MYKLSYYNYFVPYKERIIYFNTLQGNSFTLSVREHDRIQQQLADPISFDLRYPSVFEQFKSLGFIIDYDNDELDHFRFRYQERVFNNRDYHLTVVNGWKNDLDLFYPYQQVTEKYSESKFIELVKNHIHYMVVDERIDSLCLEFAGGEPLLDFTNRIQPICQYAKQICMKSGIDFHGQIATNGLLLPDVMDHLEINGIKSIKVTLEDSEKRHNKIRHCKGKATFQIIREQIIKLCNNIPKLHILLEIRCYSDSKKETLQSILDYFPSSIRERITLDFCFQNEKLRKEEFAKEYEVMLNSLKTHGFATNFLSEKDRWIKRTVRRVYQRILMFNGDLYWDYHFVFSPELAMGYIDESNGKVIPYDAQYIHASGLYWFENERCRTCKLLPLLYEQCAERCGFDKNNVDLFCMMRDTTFTPEQWVVKSFEIKNTLIAMGIKK